MSKPNIVVCLCDQLRPFEVGCYGHSVVQTPNLDAMAEAGVRLDVAVSNNPVCTPARSCLLSGQYSRTCTARLGNEGDESPPFTRPRFPDQTLPEVLHESGYHTALFGKWHVGSHPGLMGFDEYVYPKFHHLNRNQVYFDKTGRAYPTSGYAEEYNQRLMGEFLDRTDGANDPFFVFYNIATPHMPFFDIPAEYQNMYTAKDTRLRPNVFVDEKLPANKNTNWSGVGWWEVYMWDYLAYWLQLGMRVPEGFTFQDLLAKYYGMISYTDYHVGRLMAQLREHGHEEDTLVVFTSDHGDMMGSHHMYNKGVLHEESIRIPMLFQWPGKLAARSVDTQVASLIDVMPTVLSLAGVSCHDRVQGLDLAPVLTGARAELEANHAFIETTGGQIGVRTLTELYGMQLEHERSGEAEGAKDSAPFTGIKNDSLYHYDFAADPFQQHNLAAEQRPRGRELAELLSTWNSRTPWMKQPL